MRAHAAGLARRLRQTASRLRGWLRGSGSVTRWHDRADLRGPDLVEKLAVNAPTTNVGPGRDPGAYVVMYSTLTRIVTQLFAGGCHRSDWSRQSDRMRAWTLPLERGAHRRPEYSCATWSALSS
ncbi:hypothetical protein GCM10027610_032470 [Dactylosporangium cerinum]